MGNHNLTTNPSTLMEVALKVDYKQPFFLMAWLGMPGSEART